MLYPANLEEKLGFDKLRQLLADRCEGELGKSLVAKMRFIHQKDRLVKLTTQAEEFVRILGEGHEFPRNNYIDIASSLQKAAIEGMFLLEEELYDFKKALITLDLCLAFFEADTEGQYPELKMLSAQVTFDRSLLKEIDRILDDRGVIKDSASPGLQRIRRQIKAEEENLRRKMDQLLRALKSQGMLKEDASPTVRDGRMVLPVPSEHKRRVKGLVHDSSATGQTVYIEPEEVLNINNEIRELEFEEREEIVRILTAITDKIRPHVENLGRANRFLGAIDFIKAKAQLALEMKAIRPDVADEPIIEWYNAFHPLLYLSYSRQNRAVVPQNIRLDEENRILLISGPNAGGKSVTLKMVGLVQYMFQCGLLVPVLETSRMGIFRSVFMDFGDDQSLDDDLSTYSSHLTHMKSFLHRADTHTLCLIDEFGGGTEPQLGGAIAEAILERLNQKQVKGVITTHYGNLKFFADRTPGVFNGAMRYDVEHLQPLYQLEMGQPGSSFALEIAQKIGLPNQVVHQARKKAGSKQVNIERLLNQLEVEKKALQDQLHTLEKKNKELDALKQQYEGLKDFQEKNKKKLLADAKMEAQRILMQANQKIEHTIREIKENKADKEITRELRKDLEKFREEVQVTPEEVYEAPQAEEVYEEVEGGELAVGDYVKMIGQEAVGEVLELYAKDVLVSIGELRTKVKKNRLVRISRKSYRQVQQSQASTYVKPTLDISRKMMDFSPKIDLRGKRAEEALQLLTDYLDAAIMLDQPHLTIIHGKGDGILRQVIREHLRKYKEIKRVEDEHADRGGPGVSLVTLR